MCTWWFARPWQTKKVHLNKFFWTIPLVFLTRITGKKAKSSRELFEQISVNAVFLVFRDFGWVLGLCYQPEMCHVSRTEILQGSCLSEGLGGSRAKWLMLGFSYSTFPLFKSCCSHFDCSLSLSLFIWKLFSALPSPPPKHELARCSGAMRGGHDQASRGYGCQPPGSHAANGGRGGQAWGSRPWTWARLAAKSTTSCHVDTERERPPKFNCLSLQAPQANL